MAAIEFAIDRPGYPDPYLAIINYDQAQQEWHWQVCISVRTTVPHYEGREPNKVLAIQAAIEAVTESDDV